MRPGSVGPKIATTGVPTAAARCIGPESFETSRRARFSTAASSTGSRSAPRTGRGVRAARETRAPSSLSPGPIATAQLKRLSASRSPSAANRPNGQRLVCAAALPGAAEPAGLRTGRRRPAPDPPCGRRPRGSGGGGVRIGRDAVGLEQGVVVAQLVDRRRRSGQRAGQKKPAPVGGVSDPPGRARGPRVDRRPKGVRKEPGLVEPAPPQGGDVGREAPAFQDLVLRTLRRGRSRRDRAARKRRVRLRGTPP